jgi:(S)-3,5-dihydroxyphenylglycine transaminase
VRVEHGDLHGALADPILDVGERPGHELPDPPARVAVRRRGDPGRPGGRGRQDFANPTGTSFTRQVRDGLLEVAAAEDLLILEDNPYGFFGAEPRPTLKSLDRDHRVIYFGSFSKACLPGVRTGYVVADQPVGHDGLPATEIAKIKSILTVNTSPIDQAIVGGMLIECGLRLREFVGNHIA